MTLIFVLAWSLVAACGPASGGPGTSTPSPSITSAPLPSLAPGFGRLDGTVVESGTQKPLADVCVVIATGGSCQPASPRTDAAGFWWIDVPAGVDWDFTWTKDGYEPISMKLHSDPSEKTVRVVLTPK